jgi:hypothetical protein
MPLIITSKAVTASPVVAGGSPSINGLLGIITDSQTSDPASDFTATIDWGDGTPQSAATIDTTGSGLFVVDGSHTYATVGNYTLIEKITYSPVPIVQTSSIMVGVVAQGTLAADVRAVHATSKRSFSGAVATYVDSNLADTAATFSPTIQWGDGVNSPSIVTGGSGSFTVSGTHTYATPGARSASVDLDGAGLRFMAAVVTEATSDFNASGQSSVLWQQTGGGLALWQMNGSTIATSSFVTSQGNIAAPDSTWSVAGVGDLDGNGTADVLWRQSGTGTLAVWSMNGASIVSSNIINAVPDATWSVAAIADFTGTGRADLLWRQSTTGTLAFWSMNGANIGASRIVSAAPDASWTIAASGDFNGDGLSDLLWRQSGTGTLIDWTMGGGMIRSSDTIAATPDATWSVAGVSDFNGDGNSDLLWRQSGTGTLALWLMNGSTIISSQIVAAAPDSSWSIVEVGDFHGTGQTDLLWRQSTTGTLAEWTMNGANIVSSRVVGASPDNSWNVQSKPTDLAGV